MLCLQALQEIGLLHWKDFDKFYSGFLLNPAAAHTLLMDPNASYQVNLQAAKQYARLLALSPCPPSLPRMLQVILARRVTSIGAAAVYVSTGSSFLVMMLRLLACCNSDAQ